MSYKNQNNPFLPSNLHVRWFNDRRLIFPHYRSVSGSIVTQKRIDRVKTFVKEIVREERHKVLAAFKAFCGSQVRIRVNFAMDKIDRTKLSSTVCVDASCYGQTLGREIWITPMKMSDELLIGTILHEALHEMCTYRGGKYISEKQEHCVMRYLGDDC